MRPRGAWTSPRRRDATYFTDGARPSAKAAAVVAQKYWTHLQGDDAARPWLLRP
jgi:hypothetical protein